MRPQDIWAPVDRLGDALGFLRMSGAFYCQSELTAPWGLTFPRLANSLMFHFVTEGSCWLRVDGKAAVKMHSGDLALVPHGEGHALLSDLKTQPANLFDLPRTDISERYEVLHHGGGGGATHVVCGAVHFDHPRAKDLVALLPRIIAVTAGESIHEEWIRCTLDFMAAEARAMRPGGETLVIRLADILVIQTIRAWLDRNREAQAGWLGALRDRQIGRALSLIHAKPASGWSLDRLASESAMSRSAFAQRFTELVGLPAMQYVTRHRMHCAHGLLQERGVAIGELARQFGYESEAAFARAFKRYVGVPPGSVRDKDAERTKSSRRLARRRL